MSLPWEVKPRTKENMKNSSKLIFYYNKHLCTILFAHNETCSVGTKEIKGNYFVQQTVLSRTVFQEAWRRESNILSDVPDASTPPGGTHIDSHSSSQYSNSRKLVLFIKEFITQAKNRERERKKDTLESVSCFCFFH